MDMSVIREGDTIKCILNNNFFDKNNITKDCFINELRDINNASQKTKKILEDVLNKMAEISHTTYLSGMMSSEKTNAGVVIKMVINKKATFGNDVSDHEEADIADFLNGLRNFMEEMIEDEEDDEYSDEIEPGTPIPMQSFFDKSRYIKEDDSSDDEKTNEQNITEDPFLIEIKLGYFPCLCSFCAAVNKELHSSFIRNTALAHYNDGTWALLLVLSEEDMEDISDDDAQLMGKTYARIEAAATECSTVFSNFDMYEDYDSYYDYLRSRGNIVITDKAIDKISSIA